MRNNLKNHLTTTTKTEKWSFNSHHPIDEPCMNYPLEIPNNLIRRSSLKNMNSYQSLPNEILIHIFKYLSAHTLCHVSQVCRLWNYSASAPILWKLLCQIESKF